MKFWKIFEIRQGVMLLLLGAMVRYQHPDWEIPGLGSMARATLIAGVVLLVMGLFRLKRSK